MPEPLIYTSTIRTTKLAKPPLLVIDGRQAGRGESTPVFLIATSKHLRYMTSERDIEKTRNVAMVQFRGNNVPLITLFIHAPDPGGRAFKYATINNVYR